MEESTCLMNCHNCDHTYLCSPYPNLSTSFPSHQNHPQAPNVNPEPTCVLAMHSWTLWLPCISSMHSRPNAPLTFPLPRIKSIPDIHTHSQPDTIQPSLFLHQVYSWCFISLATAVRQSLIACLPPSMCPSPSFLALYILVSLLFTVCSSVSSFTTLHSSFTTLCSFLYVLSSVPCLRLPSFHLSLFLTSVNPTLVIPYFPYDPFPIVQINLILTTPALV